MDALSGWLRQIIAVVLLASLIDLLLPNRTMQRYVRLVAGLFILLTVITPALSWIKSDFGSHIASGIAWVEQDGDQGASQLAQIQADAQRLQGTRQAQAERLAVVQLEAQIRSAVEQSEGRGVDQVKVQTKPGTNGQAQIASVQVLMQTTASLNTEADPSQGASGIQEVKPMTPVAPVSIDITIQPIPSPAATPPSATSKTQAEAAGREEQIRIGALIAGQFGIAANLVQVLEVHETTTP